MQPKRIEHRVRCEIDDPERPHNIAQEVCALRDARIAHERSVPDSNREDGCSLRARTLEKEQIRREQIRRDRRMPRAERRAILAVSYTHLRAHETPEHL